jgi:hypothetical protein
MKRAKSMLGVAIAAVALWGAQRVSAQETEHLQNLKGNIRIAMEAAEGIERCSGGFVVEILHGRQDDNAVVDECSRWGTGQAETQEHSLETASPMIPMTLDWV